MVICNMDIPRPPPPPLFNQIHPLGSKLGDESMRSKKSAGSQGFRLLENQDDTGSVYSIYKQKIDSMFESDSSTNTKNSVQARIEKMFSDVAKDGGIPISEIGCHLFSVDYMGSVPLQHKVASLAGLQDPLKELYFAYKRNSSPKQPLTGRMEISAGGLKVQYQGEKGDLEQLNSFPTIAVWSAVKFVLHEEKGKTLYAFLPLITDPDNIDKQTLFRTLDANDDKYIKSTTTHSPLFAVVMRKIGIHKQLECHGFICQTSEDAIVIAATLYKSLIAHMKSKDKRPKNKNGITCMSVSSSGLNESSSNLAPVRPPRKKRSTSSSTGSDKDVVDNLMSQTSASANHPPKKSIKNKRAPQAPAVKLDMDAILPYEEPSKENEQESKPAPLTEKWNALMSVQQKQITAEIKQVISEGTHRGLQKAQSLTNSGKKKKKDDGTLSKLSDISGDILTKVTIPRSGSFLNAGGLTRYKSKVSRSNGQATGGSPLGFHELFNEFRLQEGLHSVDEILGVIIDSDGMSFNDLKPIYKEFLLKLAVTLTKDELYQRSKAIMRRQKKKLLRRNSNLKSNKKNLIVNQRFKSLKHIFRKTLKVKLGRKFSSCHRQKVVNSVPKTNTKSPESSISTSSYDTKQFRPKCTTAQGAKRQVHRRRSEELKADASVNQRDRISTSEESDFFSLRKGKNKGQFHIAANQNRNSSSGYVSCSECSYDSDTCTCISADKCYCSLGQKNLTRKHKGKCNRSSVASCQHSCNVEEKCYCTWKNAQESLSLCGCDTDSCTDSNKCYCQKGEMITIVRQLKQHGYIPATESLISCYAGHKKLCKNYSNTKSSKSLEYMHNPSEQYYQKLQAKQLQNLAKRNSYAGRTGRSLSTENLAVDYELFTVSNRKLHSRSFYGKSASECGHSPICRHGSVRSYSDSFSYNGRRDGKTLRSTSVSTGACTEALSVKKSAEIAALFADIKLSQTTDITHLIPQDYEKDIRSMYKNMQDRNFSKLDNCKTKRLTDAHSIIPTNGRLLKSSLYASKGADKNKMYSARNGLYTIQSQSDESRRSSICESGLPREDREFFNFKSQFEHEDDKPLSANIEDSLGYLP